MSMVQQIQQLEDDNKELENMILELLLSNKLILVTLIRDKIEMTMSTHTVMSAQDRRASEVRDRFEKYINKLIQRNNVKYKDLKKQFEEIEKL